MIGQTMHGQMMQMPLLISSLLVHADRHHGDTQIVSRRVEGDLHRYTYRDGHRRARQLANALIGLGVKPSQRVGTLAWNGYRHRELYYAISGSGAVLHTINPHLRPDQLVYMLDHAEDEYLFFDLSFAPIIELIAHRTKTVKAFVAMTDRDHRPHVQGVANLLCYEDLIDGHSDSFAWPVLDELSASSLCYTSGTTGYPKGVLWGERPLSVVLPKPGPQIDKAGLLELLRGEVPRWSVPDDVVFVDTLPLGATGKVLKSRLREQFRGHLVGEGANA